MAKKRNPIPFNVVMFNHNKREVEAYNIMPYLMDCYANTKKKKRLKTPVTFEEFKQFVKDESRYMYWSRCEWEVLVAHWPFGSKRMTDELKAFLKKDVNLDDYGQHIDFLNIIIRDMDKMDVFWQIMNNHDVVTRLLMENVGATQIK